MIKNPFEKFEMICFSKMPKLVNVYLSENLESENSISQLKYLYDFTYNQIIFFFLKIFI